MTAADVTARESLRQLILGFRLSQVIIVAAELGIADHLVDGPRSSAELAPIIGADPTTLHRLMRAVAALDIFAMAEDGSFTLAPMGQLLRSDTPGTLRPIARFWNLDVNRIPWRDLQYSVMTGESAFEHQFGQEKFEYLNTKPDIAALYNAGMAGNTNHIGATIAKAHDFGSFGTIVDVGGGNGSLLGDILRQYDTARGIVFDLAHAGDDARALLVKAGLEGRGEFVAGNFFESVPTGADAYLMRMILHDWNDQQCIAILQTCRRAMAPGSNLFVIERLLPDQGKVELEPMIADINMLVQVGGQERTAAEFAALMEAADLILAEVIGTGTMFNLLRTVPA